jgi:hypothetical protein
MDRSVATTRRVVIDGPWVKISLMAEALLIQMPVCKGKIDADNLKRP